MHKPGVRNAFGLIVSLFVIVGCANIFNESQSAGSGTGQPGNTLLGNWKDAATNRTYSFSATEMTSRNSNGTVYDQASYTIDKDVLTATYTRYHGLLMGGENIEKFKFSFTTTGCDFTPIDDAGFTGTTIKLVR